ncbi:TPM domain-containing protein [Lysinibacillus fusiformis]|jgi:uncharacterized protein|uniref:TPM domain-containing protein n=1 Tax=Lysinibacillus sp. PWR01 TaxID=3342384 RepID=UPI00372D0F8E
MMNKKVIFMFLICMTMFLFSQKGTYATTVPAPVGDIYVQDFMELLTKEEKAQLIQMAKELEEETSAKIVLLTIQTTGEQTIAEFAKEAFRQYGVGGEGVLFVLAMEDRKTRIEVGDDLAGIIYDELAGQILDDYTIPALQEEEPNQAIFNTFEVLIQTVKEGHLSQSKSWNFAEWGLTDWLAFLLFAAIGLTTAFFLILFIMGLFMKGDQSKGAKSRSEDSTSYWHNNDNDSGGGGGADRGW